MSRKSPKQRFRYREKQAAKRAAYQKRCADLRTAGASCGSCLHWERLPYFSGRVPGVGTHHCSIDSDFHGYVLREASDICDRYKVSIGKERAVMKHWTEADFAPSATTGFGKEWPMTARDVIAQALAKIDGLTLGQAVLYPIYRSGAEKIINALRAAGLWAAPWEATAEMVSRWNNTRYAPEATVDMCARQDWAAMRDAYLQPKPGADK